jgi:hypothetical protein
VQDARGKGQSKLDLGFLSSGETCFGLRLPLKTNKHQKIKESVFIVKKRGGGEHRLGRDMIKWGRKIR